MDRLYKIILAILGWLGLIELIVGAFTAFNLHDAIRALVFYGISLGVIGLVCLIFLTGLWIADEN